MCILGRCQPHAGQVGYRWASKVPSPLLGSSNLLGYSGVMEQGGDEERLWSQRDPELEPGFHILMFPDASLGLFVSTSEIIIPAFK